MLPSKSTKIAGAVPVLFITAAIALYWYAETIKVEPYMEPATTTVAKQYVSNAALYRYPAAADAPKPPLFVTRVLLQDHKHLKNHLRNTAAKRHWLTFDTRQYAVTRYVLPYYDIAIVRQIAKDPYQWARQAERRDTEYAPQPDPNDMMKAAIYIKTYEPHSAFLAGGILATVFATVATIVASSMYATDIMRNSRKKANATN